ncbi:alpha-L-fucosidase [Kribbella aluminosa]|uniref:alpha-L-fucosidase n=1 Tax=Kribbella aluminosa TaxID=416017 RepID=A0ABS4UWS7_9ACTN|nr:alpha-L-fucosidase [Kribbella aluminosa]MBP2356118.1 alpha-L-fucosidase [Kribbella aluminosa]
MTHAEEPARYTWEQIQQKFTCPAWFAEARFGIWVHWGAQTQPAEGGGWYGRHMYMEDVGDQTWGADAYSYHLKTYGHPSEKGFKDVIHEWKAENLDADALLEYFAGLGARYFVALANHHDHFDNFDSTYQPWNSVNVGPKRDLIAEFAAASRRIGMPFGISSHDDRMLMFYEHAFGADSSGPKAGVPYDGNLTAADGAGTWWEGLDPADLYGPPPARRTADWVADMQHKWELRLKELIEKARPDMLWFDGHGFPYGEHGKEVCRAFYSGRLTRTGELDGVVVAKIPGDRAIVQDVERGAAEDLQPDVWQGTSTFTSWFLKTDKAIKHDARTLIEMLVDIVSKNGNFLLNVELTPDGRVPDDHRPILDGLGEWLAIHGEAIFATKPWHVYGDNLASDRSARTVDEADLAGAEEHPSGHFIERTLASPPYPSDEVRFTTRDGHLYVFVLNPRPGEIVLPQLGTGSSIGLAGPAAARLIGSDAPVHHSVGEQGLSLEIPHSRPSLYTAVFDLTFRTT